MITEKSFDAAIAKSLKRKGKLDRAFCAELLNVTASAVSIRCKQLKGVNFTELPGYIPHVRRGRRGTSSLTEAEMDAAISASIKELGYPCTDYVSTSLGITPWWLSDRYLKFKGRYWKDDFGRRGTRGSARSNFERIKKAVAGNPEWSQKDVKFQLCMSHKVMKEALLTQGALTWDGLLEQLGATHRKAKVDNVSNDWLKRPIRKYKHCKNYYNISGAIEVYES